MKSMLLAVVAAALGAAVLGTSASASYLGDEEAAPARDVVIPTSLPLPPRPDNALTRYVRAAAVGAPHTYRGLTVFPVTAGAPTDPTAYLSLREALKSGALQIVEHPEPQVPTVWARNKGKQPVLMLSGEVIAGGWQNRVLQEDVLLPGRSGKVNLPVYCVEQGRWHNPNEEFSDAPAMAAHGVRAAAEARRGQAEVWDGVRHYQDALRVSAPTGDLGTVQRDPELRKALDGYVKEFKPVWRKETVGMVVARGGRIVVADLFCNGGVFRKHRDRLLESYAIDCYVELRDVAERIAMPPGRQQARQFLDRALTAGYSERGTPGAGRLLDVSRVDMRGTALVYRDRVLHAVMFDRARIIPVRRPMPRPPLPQPPMPQPHVPMIE